MSLQGWAQGWVCEALYEEEGWPHDPLNRGILLALLYFGFPLIVFASIAFQVTGWARIFPIWLSTPLVIYVFLFGWAALDEWRSRRRLEAGSGHGWIWQMIQQFGPRRWVNQTMVAFVAATHFAGAALTYVDRFSSRDLEYADTIRIAQALAIITVDMWWLAITVAFVRMLGPTAHFWAALRIPLVVLLGLNALVSVDDRPFPWIVVPLLVTLAIALPGWLLHAVWRRRGSSAGEEIHFGSTGTVRPAWW